MAYLTCQGVIEAMEACQQRDGCNTCPLGINGEVTGITSTDDCQAILYREAIEAIERLTTENERLLKMVEVKPARQFVQVPRKDGKTMKSMEKAKESFDKVGYPNDDTI